MINSTHTKKTNTVRSHLHVEFLTVKFTEKENSLVVPGQGGRGSGETLVKGYELPIKR